MTPIEIGSLAIAILSLLVSGGTYALSHHQLRVGSRNEFQKLLIELDKELVRDPELWAVYDAHPMAGHRRDDPAYRAKLEAFAYMFLNIFQVVFVYSRDRLRATPHDRGYFAAFEGTQRDFICGSSLAREILWRPDADILYDPGFLHYSRAMFGG